MSDGDTSDFVLNALAGANSPYLLVAAIIGIPSVVLYIAQILLVLRHPKELNSSFFKLFLARAIPAVLNMLNTYWSFRFGMLNLFLSLYLKFPRWFLAFLLFNSYYSFSVENISTMLILMNRLTSIILPLKYNKIWYYALPFAIGLIFLAPLTLNYGIWGLNLTINTMNFTGTETFGFADPQGEQLFSYRAAVSGVLFMVICACLNLATLFSYMQLRKRTSGVQSSDERMEIRLTIYAILTFFCQMAMALAFLSFYVCTIIGTPKSILVLVVIFNHFALLNDLCTVAVPAWLLFWASSKIRELMLNDLQAIKLWYLTKILRREIGPNSAWCSTNRTANPHSTNSAWNSTNRTATHIQ